jgi:hypothetical protein
VGERVEAVAELSGRHVRLHALEHHAQLLALRRRERLVGHIHDARGHATCAARQKVRKLVAKVVAVVREQIVRVGREARR